MTNSAKRSKAKTVFKYLFLALAIVEMVFLCVQALLPGSRSSGQSEAVGNVIDNVMTDLGGDGVRDVPPTALSLMIGGKETEELSLAIGKSVKPALSFLPENTSSNHRNAEWKTSDESVVAIVGGKLTAAGIGEAVVTVSLPGDGIEAELKVNVFEIVATELSLTFEDGSSSILLKEGEAVRLNAALTPENATASVKFYSENEAVADVSKEGIVHAKGIGKTDVVAVYTPFDGEREALTARATIEVTEGVLPLPPSSFSLALPKNIHDGIVYIGDRGTFSAAPMSAIDPSDSFIYTSSDPHILSVDIHTGAFEAKKKGETVVTVSSAAFPECSVSAALTVCNSALNVSLSSGEATPLQKTEGDCEYALSVRAGTNVPLALSADPAEIFVRYSSSDPAVAEIGEDGVILPYRAAAKSVVLTVEVADNAQFSREGGGLAEKHTILLSVAKQSFSSGVSGWGRIIRKLFGHFGAFLILGALLGTTAALFDKGGWKRRLIIFAILILVGFAFAGLTEILQLPLFTAGRGASFKDVLIDFSGYLPAALLVYGGYLLIRLIAERVKRRKRGT